MPEREPGRQPVGQSKCADGHRYTATDLGAGMRRLECRHCDSVTIDLDAAEDGSVTAPGLFGPARPTIFSVLAEEQRKMDQTLAAARAEAGSGGGPRFAFGGGFRNR